LKLLKMMSLCIMPFLIPHQITATILFSFMSF
jgi:hypothetical protein